MRYLIGNRPISSSFVPTSRILFSLKIPLIFFLRYAARFRSNIKRFPKRISEMENKIPKKGKKKKHEPLDSKNDILPIQFLHP